jgi:hypothetical protein
MPGAEPPRLVFVYNAADGIVSAAIDAAHKLVSPATYPCSLCAITYGAVAMRGEWRAWLKRLAVEPRFFHREGFARAYRSIDEPLPLVLIERDGAIDILLDADTLAQQADVAMLIATLERLLAERAPDAFRTPGAP